MTKHRLAVILGTRPEAIKLAPVVLAAKRDRRFEVVTISTGQHREMLTPILEAFGVSIDHELAVMTHDQSLPTLTGRLLDAVSNCLAQSRPDFVLVQGDTTTAFAAALACFYAHLPVGHVEAGLRTQDVWSPFPEEANRRMITVLSSLHFAPTEAARDRLLGEGVAPHTVTTTGNTVIDALLAERDRQSSPEQEQSIRDELSSWLPIPLPPENAVLITGHRRESFGAGFLRICHAIRHLAEEFPEASWIYPVHLNPRVQEPVQEVLQGLKNVYLLPPLSYATLVFLLRHCRLVLTDSGGIQEEAPSLGKPVLVMRETTEREEGIEAGTARLVGTSEDRIVSEVRRLLTEKSAYAAMSRAVNPYGDGQAAERILETLAQRLAQ